MHINLKNDSRLRQQCSKVKLSKKRRGGSRVQPLPIPVKLAGTSERRPFLISQIKASVFVSARLAMIPGTPCKLVKTNKKFYICSDGTHTHTSHVARLDFLEELRWRNRQYTSESEPVRA